MPQVTVYIRKDDLPKWEALEKKAQFLHDALNGSLTFKKGDTVSAIVVKPAEAPAKPTMSVGVSPERLQNGVCKEHGTPLDSRGKCLQRKCKYS